MTEELTFTVTLRNVPFGVSFHGQSGPATVQVISPRGLGATINLHEGDIITEIGGCRLTGGADQASTLFENHHGQLEIKVRRPRLNMNDHGESSSDGGDSPHGWGPATRVTIRRGEANLGITVGNHLPGEPGPGVRIEDLELDGSCHAAGLVTGHALIAVNGKTVKNHRHAIELLEAANFMSEQDVVLGPNIFEAVFRPKRGSERHEIIQSL
eukprot:CAMPEP_0174731810 /NCGR_PEP_ID=MMETSP1094-20130205/58215_1 /TAXON_ID=156173 /ORGANISM="Chrysochromulina brevifilum, Strain UTEX LB 985" /LENGTH=211 /DNA_ID=CAMNT_0015934231 /DNA_START=75 /DNA_END=710 /DNA_ORIENTATION=+